jgi:hypothetical protein
VFKLDYYLLKPWHPAEEKLFPVVNDLLENGMPYTNLILRLPASLVFNGHQNHMP